MEFRLTVLILLPLGLIAVAVYALFLRPLWRKSVERLQKLDYEDAKEKQLREEAERELLHGDINQ